MEISFLGGLGEIGMNMYVYETETTAIIVDCGVMFADLSLPGVDYIIPDFSYIYNIKDKIKGIVATHGHEDHIGGISYLLKNFNVPIYGGKLTLNLLKHKLTEEKVKAELKVISDMECVVIDDISISFLQINHSIPDTFCIKIKGKNNTFIHMSDFKIDKTPISQKPFSEERVIKFLENEVITGILIDSTSCQREGVSPSEKSVYEDLYKIISCASGRVFFTTFSSNIDRISQVLDICEKLKRKVVIEGRSITKNINIATQLGYLKYNPENIISLSNAKKYEDNKLCFIISGCQGEVNSTLYKIVSKERNSLQVKKGDLFIISSRVIPGNEKNLAKAINHIFYYEAEVVDIEKENIHVSGHAYREDVKIITSLIRPKYFIPIHGEYTHLRKNIQNITEDLDFSSSNCIFTENGKKIAFDNNQNLISVSDIPFGKTYIDTRGGFIFGEEELKIRKNMARDGVFLLSYSLRENDFKIIDLNAIGFTLTNELQYYIKKQINDNIGLLIESSLSGEFEFDEILTKFIKKIFKKRFDRRPEIKVIKDGFNIL
ncbi:ribonuclease J [Deferribacteraceae bacterium V6Fe1]|nr:ribonuclease J [Deferribacteraceae bacterium V6Fe1]